METVEVTTVKKRYIETCPYCNKRLKPAISLQTAKWNLESHMRQCEKNPSNKKNAKE